MKQDTGSVLSLAFVDVLANSFASLLVLFFIMVTVRGALEWGETTRSNGGSGSGQGKPVSPFLVLVKVGRGPQPAFVGDPWKKEKDDRGEFAYRTTVGPDYVVLYADRPPPSGVVLRLHLTRPGLAGKIQVYQEGRALTPQPFDANIGSVLVRTARPVEKAP